MITVPYNPFKGDFTEIHTSDLAVLRDVAEGWYVEYKRELKSAKDIAKSLAAFANHYGGWIFYGIEQSSDGSNKAGNFPGLTKDDVSILLERMRNAAKDNISPSPYYEHRVLDGPCTEIGLAQDRSIVMVLVPSGPDSPYLHSEGRIYRRIADASDPKPETDRFILDHLWQRRQRAYDKLTAFLEEEPLLSEGEREKSFIDLFLLPDPLGTMGLHTRLKFDRFVELMANPLVQGVSSTFDNFYTMPDGFVARQVSINDPYNLTTTFRHFRNGFTWVSIPFSSADIRSSEIASFLDGYKHKDDFLQLATRHSGFVIDINSLVFLTFSVFGQHKLLMQEGEIEGPLHAKTALHNVWRRIPFFDTDEYIKFASKYGLPVIQFNDAYAPPGMTLESLRWIEQPKSDNLAKAQVDEAMELIFDLFTALGLSPSITLKSNTIMESGWRAIEVNKRRTEEFLAQLRRGNLR